MSDYIPEKEWGTKFPGVLIESGARIERGAYIESGAQIEEEE